MSSIGDAVTGMTAPFATRELAAAVAELIVDYRDGPATVRLDTPARIAAYAAYRMPATHAAARSVLAATRAAVHDLAPRTALDVGGGTGATAWAVAESFPTLSELRIIEASEPVSAAGRTLARSADQQVLREAIWQVADVTGSPSRPVDLATAGYLLGELPADAGATLVGQLAGSAGTVVLIEPGTPAGFERIRAARRILVEAGMRVAAPCPHGSECPMAGDWCHFSARFERSALARRLKEARHGHEDEKHSYVVGTRLPVNPPAARIIRHPRYRKGLVTLELCTAEGSLATTSISRSQGDAYRRARDAGWGEGWAG